MKAMLLNKFAPIEQNPLELKDMPKYHDEVQVFEVKNKDGRHQAVLYMDFHPRPGKRVGAWCGRFRQQTYKNGEKI